MRLVSLGLAAAASAALGGFPVAAAQGSPVTTQPLAAGQVLLELTAVGIARQRADLATFTLSLVCHAATEAEATRLMEQRVEQIRSIAGEFGATEDDIRVRVRTSLVEPSELLLEEMEADDLSPGPDSAARPQHAVRSTVEVRLRDIDRVPAFSDRLKALGIANLGGPAYSLSDEREARRRARNEAIATLRADADAYAASLGMRVLRLVRVSERLGTDLFSVMAGGGPAARSFQATMSGASTGSEVEVVALVSADFALAPQ